MTSATPLHWYVVQARSGFEKSVAQALRDRVARLELSEQFGEILVPSEDVVEMRDGQKRRSERKFFPGYVLVQIASTEAGGIPRISSEAWHLVKETPKVSGFIGGTADRPLPIQESEANKILSRVSSAAEKPAPKVLFETNQSVRIKEGPFEDFNGIVKDVDYDKSTVKIDVLVFGRATTVEFPITQIEAA